LLLYPIGTGNGWASGVAIVYRFVEHGWVREAELIAEDGAIGDMMGVSVDVSDGRVIAGAWFNYILASKLGRKFLKKFISQEKINKLDKFFENH